MKFAHLAIVAAFAAGPALAQTPAATTHTTTTTVTKPAATKTAAVKKVATTKTTTAKPMMMTGSMVKTTTKTGKSITYDCSKAGNKTKTACKK